MLSGTFGIELEFGSTLADMRNRYRSVALAAIRSVYPRARLGSGGSRLSWGGHHEMGNGFEVTTPAMTWRRWARARRVVDNLRNTEGITLNNQYGTHVHFGTEDLTSESTELNNLRWFWWQHQNVIYRLVKRSRRNNTFCTKLIRPRSRNIAEIRNNVTDAVNAALRANGITENVRNSYYWTYVLENVGLHSHDYDTNLDRYRSLNTGSMGTSRRTIEVRLHHGTLDTSELDEWIELMQGVLTKGLVREYPTYPVTPYQANINGIRALKRDLTSPVLSRIIDARITRYQGA